MVTAEIRYLDAQAGRLVMGHALEIGKRLTEAKALVAHGEWGSYLETELHYTQTTANKLMKVFDEYGASQIGLFGPEVNSETFTNLTYSKALALLSVPREEREAFAQAVDAEHLSTRELQQAIRERDEARKALQTSEARLEDTQRTLAETDRQVSELHSKLAQAREDIKAADDQAMANERELKARITELESRPVEVAVQEPDPNAVEKLAAELANKAKEELEQKAAKEVGAAEEKAAKAAEALKKAQEKAKAEREKLEAQLKEAEGKLAAAGEADKAEAEKLRAEAEALRKQLAMSSQEITVFKLRFAAWQEAHKLMTEAFAALPDEETKEKMRAAIRAQVKAWGWTDEG
jgi:DNA repair exonuclease SbcCD ATPase subunit